MSIRNEHISGFCQDREASTDVTQHMVPKRDEMDDSTTSSSESSNSSSGSSSSSTFSSDSSSTEIKILAIRDTEKKLDKPTPTPSKKTPISGPHQKHLSTKVSTKGSAQKFPAASPDRSCESYDDFGDGFPWYDDDNLQAKESTMLIPNATIVENCKGSHIPSSRGVERDSSSNFRSINLDNSGVNGEIGLSFQECSEIGSIGPSFQQERPSEIEPSYYVPAPFEERQPPAVHRLSLQSRPLNTRTHLPLKNLFKAPVINLWKNKFDKFNHLQSEVSSVLVNTNDIVVVSAPTGAGKTAVFEIAMARHIASDLEVLQQSSGWQQRQLPSYRKLVYIAPSKALCEERYIDWSRRLAEVKIGIRTAMITGDAEPGDCYRDIATSHLILTTPEKWDSLTRRWTENYTLFASVKLVMVDEVHLLGDSSRGSCLEAVICRLKTIFRATQKYHISESQIASSSYTNTTPNALSSFLRIVAVSATLPNIDSIAAFLGANEAFEFDASYRPVPLTIRVVNCGHAGSNAFMFAKKIDRNVPGIIRQFSNDKPTIIFCHTKKETESLAAELSTLNGITLPQDNHELAGQTNVSSLQRCLLKGIAYHHAGLEAHDRKLVEKAFLDLNIKCLCATSTLAVGVNLPAHLVVIKGTSAWRGTGKGYQEIEKSSLLQMIGRAGRPGYDSSGTAVIMTDHQSQKKYKEINSSLETVESHLQLRLVEVLNNEISQKVVTSFKSACDWLATTFLFQSTKKQMATNQTRQVDGPAKWLIQTCGIALKMLDDAGVISVKGNENQGNGVIAPLFPSHVMSQHMVDFESMKLIMQLPFDSETRTLLEMLSKFDGLHQPVRRSEKRFLNAAHKAIKFKFEGPPSKVRVQEPQQKTFVLLQAAIGQQFLDDYTLRQEMSSIVEYSTRMLAAAEEYSVYGSKHGIVALRSLSLRRSLAVSLWGTGDGVLNQLRGVGQETTAKLRFNSIVSFNDVLENTEDALDKAAGRSAPFGEKLREAVAGILSNALKMTTETEKSTSERKYIVCHLSRHSISNHAPKDASHNVAVRFTLLAYTDRPGGCLFFQQNVESPGEHRFRCPEKFGKIHIHLISSLVGLDEVITIDGNDGIHPSTLASTPLKKSAREVLAEAGAGNNAKALGRGKRAKMIRDPRNHLKNGFKIQSKAVEDSKTTEPVTPSPVPTSVKRPRSHAHRMDKGSIKENTNPGKTRDASDDIEASQNPVFSKYEVHRARDNSNPTSLEIMSSLSQNISKQSGEENLQQIYCSPSWGNGRQRRSSDLQSKRKPFNAQTVDLTQDTHVSPKNKWKKERREQSAFQKRAFRSEAENPFSRFQYDPNDAENNLDTITNKASSQADDNCSILPPDAFPKDKTHQKPKLWRKGPTRLRGKRSYPASYDSQ